MTSLLSMLDRFEQAAVTYETSTAKADRDELHAARRAIMERDAELITRVASNADHARLANANHDLMAKALASMREREAELVKALEPFAVVAEHDIGETETDQDWFRPMTQHNRAPRLTVGHLRAARAAINPSLEQE